MMIVIYAYKNPLHLMKKQNVGVLKMKKLQDKYLKILLQSVISIVMFVYIDLKHLQMQLQMAIGVYIAHHKHYAKMKIVQHVSKNHLKQIHDQNAGLMKILCLLVMF
jgi:ABC-type uncharacterized transport system permease subunit